MCIDATEQVFRARRRRLTSFARQAGLPRDASTLVIELRSPEQVQV
jgi:hypothetical protein